MIDYMENAPKKGDIYVATKLAGVFHNTLYRVIGISPSYIPERAMVKLLVIQKNKTTVLNSRHGFFIHRFVDGWFKKVEAQASLI